MKIDKYDVSIINSLQNNARTSLADLAQSANLSTASVQRRLRALRDTEVILRDVAVIDPVKVGQRMSFIVLVELERERRDQIDRFIDKADQEPQVQQCYYVTGEADFCLICTARDMEDFEGLTQRLFFKDSNVRRFKTSVVMGRKKVGLQVFVSSEQ